jgi:membrane-associated phospholipid phosphatase
MTWLDVFYQWQAELLYNLGFYKIAHQMTFLKFFDSIDFYYLLLILFFIFYGKRWGMAYFFLDMCCLISVFFLKILFLQPRPFAYISVLQAVPATSYGFPSGAALASICICWLILEANERSKKAWAFSISLFVLMNVSRLVLGVHFFSDLVGGWVFGLVLVAIFKRCKSLIFPGQYVIM